MPKSESQPDAKYCLVPLASLVLILSIHLSGEILSGCRPAGGSVLWHRSAMRYPLDTRLQEEIRV